MWTLSHIVCKIFSRNMHDLDLYYFYNWLRSNVKMQSKSDIIIPISLALRRYQGSNCPRSPVGGCAEGDPIQGAPSQAGNGRRLLAKAPGNGAL